MSLIEMYVKDNLLSLPICESPQKCGLFLMPENRADDYCCTEYNVQAEEG